MCVCAVQCLFRVGSAVLGPRAKLHVGMNQAPTDFDEINKKVTVAFYYSLNQFLSYWWLHIRKLELESNECGRSLHTTGKFLCISQKISIALRWDEAFEHAWVEWWTSETLENQEACFQKRTFQIIWHFPYHVLYCKNKQHTKLLSHLEGNAMKTNINSET